MVRNLSIDIETYSERWISRIILWSCSSILCGKKLRCARPIGTTAVPFSGRGGFVETASPGRWRQRRTFRPCTRFFAGSRRIIISSMAASIGMARMDVVESITEAE